LTDTLYDGTAVFGYASVSIVEDDEIVSCSAHLSKLYLSHIPLQTLPRNTFLERFLLEEFLPLAEHNGSADLELR
jgi:hypothetical protein